MVTWLELALIPIGLFTVALGTVHFFFPRLLDFEHAIPLEGPELRPFRLGPLRHATRRSDVLGIAWVMNHAASYVLVTIGLLDVFGHAWLASPAARWIDLWIAGWWFLRAISELYLGRRRFDWIVLAGFGVFGLVHLALVVLV